MAFIDQYGDNEQAVISLFATVLNKAPTPDLIAAGAELLAAGGTQGQILDVLFNHPQVPLTAYKSGASTSAFVSKLVDSLAAGTDISAETKAGWVAYLETELGGFSSRGEFAATLVHVIENGTWPAGSDLATLQASLVAKTESAAESAYDSDAVYAGWGALEGVTEGGNGEASDSNVLTYGTDYLFGHDVYNAPVVQNPTLGNITNTLETGDTILGKAGGGGVLNADLVLTTQGGIPIGPAISSITNNIDKIVLRAQTTNSDILTGIHGNLSHIDAERNVGVKEWWTQDSRSTIQIEDVRTLPEDTTIGVRNTDPEVGFRVYFDPAQLLDRVSSQSVITLTLGDVDRPNSLEFVPIDGVGFYLDGEAVVLRSTAIGEAKTYTEFVAALNAAIAATPAAAGLVATLNADNSISIDDPAGGTFTKGGWQFIDNSVPADGNLFYNQVVGNPTLSTEPVTTSVILDAVGRTSAGGVVDIGSLGDGGVERFNVAVDRNSWVSTLQSSEHLNAGGVQDQFLEIVNLTSIGANGNVKVGSTVANRTDSRLANGVTDVRVVDASAFKGTVNIGINVTVDSIGRYLDDATAPVNFDYTGSAQNDIFNVAISSAVSNDPDFRSDIDLGAGDDRLILSGADFLKNISVDGGTGTNTFVTSTSVGVSTLTAPGTTAAQHARSAADHTFASFENFQNYEVEGAGFTSHDFTNLGSVESVVVAVDNAGGVNLIDLPDGQAIVVSGKNQTAATNQSNAAQNIAQVWITSADGAEQKVKLDNTARIDGKLTVGVLVVQDGDSLSYLPTTTANGASAVRTLEIESAGERSTTNEVTGIWAERVANFNFSGTQNFTTTINEAAHTLAKFANSQVSDLKVNGSALEGNLNLTVAGEIVNRVDLLKTASFVGTEGSSDVLTFGGAAALNTTSKTSVSGFETVAFTQGGNFDAVNAQGVDLYKNAPGSALKLFNLQSTEDVELGTATANAGGTQQYRTTQQSASSALDLVVKSASAGAQQINTKGFTTLNLDLDSTVAQTAAQKSYNLDLSRVAVDAADNAVVTTSGYVGTAAAKPVTDFTNSALTNVVVTGGVGTTNAVTGVVDDKLNLNTLASTVKVLDVSGYDGVVTATIGNPLSSTIDGVVNTTGNTEVVVGAYGINITDVNHSAVAPNTVTTFRFTEDAALDPSSTNIPLANKTNYQWVINGFEHFVDGVTPLTDISILDLSALGITGVGGLVMSAGANVSITANDPTLKFEIILTGVTAAELTLENFKFAA